MNIFETIILITMASLGFRCITDKGMIFYFLRKPFDKISERKKAIEKEILEAKKLQETYQKIVDSNIKEFGKDHLSTSMYKDHQSKIFAARTIIVMSQSPAKYDWLIYCMKPIILCGTCMSSVHTLIWWPILVGEYTLFTIVTMLSVAFLNTLLYLIIEKLQGK